MKTHTIISWLLAAVLAASSNPAFARKEISERQNGRPFHFITSRAGTSATGVRSQRSMINETKQPEIFLSGTRRLVPQEYTSIQAAGSYKVVWNASGFASGIYIYKLQTDKGFSLARKLVLLK